MSAAAPSGPVFIAADVFDGAREGYVFKAGDEGFGYYLDAQRWATAVKPHACECGKTFATEVNLGRHRDGGCPLNHPAPPFSGGVLQDDFSAGNGNALQAAVATLEGLTLGDVPNFVREPAGIEGSSVTWPGYEAELTKWLAARHQGFVKIPLRNDKFPLAASPGMRCIVRGRSPRGEHGHVSTRAATRAAYTGALGRRRRRRGGRQCH
ncbi:hypothetical protein M885DRAFT_13358 [Pelagophyceae sp. CCMP2097]|nr:hypothetical protein M885DRAFT_13358 [Pelagophyceae sp. CCMP2097]